MFKKAIYNHNSFCSWLQYVVYMFITWLCTERNTRLLEYMGCNIFLVGYRCAKLFFLANQNAHYVSLYIHVWHSSFQKNIYFVNYKQISQTLFAHERWLKMHFDLTLRAQAQLTFHPPPYLERTSGRLADFVRFVLINLLCVVCETCHICRIFLDL